MNTHAHKPRTTPEPSTWLAHGRRTGIAVEDAPMKTAETTLAVMAVFLLFFSLKGGFETYFHDWDRTSQADPMMIALSAGLLVIYVGRRLLRRFV